VMIEINVVVLVALMLLSAVGGIVGFNIILKRI